MLQTCESVVCIYLQAETITHKGILYKRARLCPRKTKARSFYAGENRYGFYYSVRFIYSDEENFVFESTNAAASTRYAAMPKCAHIL